MIPAQSALLLLGVVGLLAAASRHPAARPLLTCCPLPFWCYTTPMALRTLGWLPADDAAWKALIALVLPVALVLLLLEMDWLAVKRLGPSALLAMLIGMGGIVLGGPLLLLLAGPHLPPEAWKGIGILAGTWTGGSANMVALQTILSSPQQVFAPLIVVDAVVTYGWMAILVACRGIAPRVNRWLGASDDATASMASTTSAARDALPWHTFAAAAGTAWLVAAGCRVLAFHLPRTALVGSPAAWTILLVTTTSLVLSAFAPMRRLGRAGARIGVPCLYVVLAALGAQANLSAMTSVPVWLAVGCGWVVFHAGCLLLGGRLLRLPLSVLATASQANVGGVISAPLVAATYGQELVPVGLVLAIGANAVGTYLGLGAAGLARWIVR